MGKKVAIIASNGGLETAYKVLNIASAAVATDAEVSIFFTFEGLQVIHKQADEILKLSPGKEHYLEGFKRANVPAVSQLLEMVLEGGAKLIACQMSMDVAGMVVEDFIEGIDVGGAMTYMDYAYDADVTITF